MLLRKNTLIMVILIQIDPSVLIIEDARIVILIADHVVLYMKKIFSGYIRLKKRKCLKVYIQKKVRNMKMLRILFFE